MSPELIKELIADTKLPDIPDRYRAIVEIVGVENYIRLSDYAKGDELYFPKVESILAPARNRRIRKEYNGYNAKELAARYNLTLPQILNIINGLPQGGQMDLFTFGKEADVDVI